MQKMRVSAMKIIKKEQEETRRRGELMTVSPREAPARASLRERMREAARKHGKRLAATVSIPARRGTDAGRIFARRAPDSRAVAGREGRRSPGGQPKQGEGRSWRYHFLVQTAVSGMILLSVLGFRAANTPFTDQVTDGIAQMVTMEVDIGKDLGRLQFVRNIVPESVLTFWESTADEPATYIQPFDGDIALPYTQEQKGIVYIGEGLSVFCVADGVVDSVARGKEGDYILKIRHDGGVDTVYGLLSGVKVAAGDTVAAGQEVALASTGNAGSHLYFQALRTGTPIDPATLFEP